MLGYAHAAGDVETSGIVDALTRMLEWPWGGCNRMGCADHDEWHDFPY